MGAVHRLLNSPPVTTGPRRELGRTMSMHLVFLPITPYPADDISMITPPRIGVARRRGLVLVVLGTQWVSPECFH